MTTPSEIFANNSAWAQKKTESDPAYFEKLAAGQKPRYLWIGCADSRVPPNVVCGLEPGEVFVHRNIANIVVHADVNVQSVIKYAVAALKVTDVVVCGHYGCGGVQAAMGTARHGVIDNWLRNIQDVYHQHTEELASLDRDARFSRLCELNVQQQVANIARTDIVQDAWGGGQSVNVHGWIFGLNNGLIKDLDVTISGMDGLPPIYKVDTK